jgi:tRNA-splicing ligase RtcB
MDFFHQRLESLGMELIYDVAHNIAKMEHHEVDGKRKLLCVHRKGATRAFPAGHAELPERYKPFGQPVIIPGDMGRASYVLVGSPEVMKLSFGSTCHGAGRVMSRAAAIRAARGRSISRELADKGIVAISRDRQGLAEEQPMAYKDVSMVVDAVVGANLARKVARMRPMGVIKG